MNKTVLAVKVFDNNAAAYQEKFMDVSLYHDTFDLFCSCMSNVDATVLDVACGPGNIAKYLLSKHPGYNVLGIDLAPRMIELAKANNPSASFRQMDCRDINTLAQKFDGIICGFCLPYLSRKEAVEFINDAAGSLNAGGVLYLSTMEGDYSTSGMQTSSSSEQLYMHFHQADYLTEALEQNSFTIVGMSRIDYRDVDGSSTVDLVIVARR